MKKHLLLLSTLLLAGCASTPNRAASSFLAQCTPQPSDTGYTIEASDGSIRLQFHDWIRIWIDSTPFVEAGVNLTTLDAQQLQEGDFFFEFKPQAYTAMANAQRMAKTFMQHNQAWIAYDGTTQEYRLNWQDVALIWSADQSVSRCDVALSSSWVEALGASNPLVGWEKEADEYRQAIQRLQP
ncbi:MAG: hypothetical protein ACRDBX_07195 [Erysipelotrichaceae bacterium]